MKRIIVLSLVLFVMLFITAAASYGGPAVNIPVSIEVRSVTDITIDKNPQPMIINTAVAGEAPTPATDSSTSYSISTNGALKKITAALDQSVPPATILKIKLSAPAGAASLGDVTLSTTPADVVTGLGKKKAVNLAITYTFSVQPTVTETPTTVRRVTFTVVDG